MRRSAQSALICALCSVQSVPNPVPRVAHPDWLHKSIAASTAKHKQRRISSMFARNPAKRGGGAATGSARAREGSASDVDMEVDMEDLGAVRDACAAARLQAKKRRVGIAHVVRLRLPQSHLPCTPQEEHSPRLHREHPRKATERALQRRDRRCFMVCLSTAQPPRSHFSVNGATATSPASPFRSLAVAAARCRPHQRLSCAAACLLQTTESHSANSKSAEHHTVQLHAAGQ
jgi:hypothetical protein